MFWCTGIEHIHSFLKNIVLPTQAEYSSFFPLPILYGRVKSIVELKIIAELHARANGATYLRKFGNLSIP